MTAPAPVCGYCELTTEERGRLSITVTHRLEQLHRDFHFFETAYCRDSDQVRTKLRRVREFSERMAAVIAGKPEPKAAPSTGHVELWPERMSV